VCIYILYPGAASRQTQTSPAGLSHPDQPASPGPHQTNYYLNPGPLPKVPFPSCQFRIKQLATGSAHHRACALACKPPSPSFGSTVAPVPESTSSPSCPRWSVTLPLPRCSSPRPSGTMMPILSCMCGEDDACVHHLLASRYGSSAVAEDVCDTPYL
jgi:hypothetical protein